MSGSALDIPEDHPSAPAATPAAPAGVPSQAGGGTVDPNAGGTDGGTEPNAGGATPEPAKDEPPKWARERIDTLTRKFREEEREKLSRDTRIAELEARLASQGQGTVQPPAPLQTAVHDAAANLPPNATHAQIMAEATRIAEGRIAEQNFTAQCNDIAAKGRAQFTDFDASMKNFGQYLGGLPQSVIESAMETDNPHATLYELGKNMTEATRIVGLPPVRQAAAVARFASKLSAPAPLPAASNAPAPITPRVGAAGNRTTEVRLDDDKVSTGDWIKKREAEIAARAKR